MNKQELINYCNVLKESKSRFINCIDVDRIIEIIKQLDEPQKVKVPQFVAVWYEENKDDFETNLLDFIENIPTLYKKDELEMFEEWFLDANTKPFQTLVNMHQFGYEVEETKYVVTDGNHLYFKGYQEDVEIVILADEQPGTMDYVKKFDTKEEAQKVADILGWKVQEVE